MSPFCCWFVLHPTGRPLPYRPRVVTVVESEEWQLYQTKGNNSSIIILKDDLVLSNRGEQDVSKQRRGVCELINTLEGNPNKGKSYG